jgi:hypothetical protein
MPTIPWTAIQIIEQCNKLTSNLAANKIDVAMEFWQGLDEFCGEKHYWWRRLLGSFTTTPPTQQYDLAGVAGGNEVEIEEVEEVFVVNATAQCSPGNVRPMFNARDQVAAAFGPGVGPFFPRSGYFITPGSPQQLQFSGPVTQALLIGYSFYAIPMITDTTTETIPLVPVFLQYGLKYMLLRRLYDFLYGQEDPRYTTADNNYQRFVLRASKSQSFSSQRAVHASSSARAIQAGGHGGGRGSRY